MSCPDKVLIGNDISFSVITHDTTNRDLSDADSEPSYRLYENETATPLLTGNLSKLDDANTTGFYIETVSCNKDNGFEVAKTYTIYIIGIIDSDAGAISYAFNVFKEPFEKIFRNSKLTRNIYKNSKITRNVFKSSILDDKP